MATGRPGQLPRVLLRCALAARALLSMRRRTSPGAFRFCCLPCPFLWQRCLLPRASLFFFCLVSPFLFWLRSAASTMMKPSGAPAQTRRSRPHLLPLIPPPLFASAATAIAAKVRALVVSAPPLGDATISCRRVRCCWDGSSRPVGACVTTPWYSPSLHRYFYYCPVLGAQRSAGVHLCIPPQRNYRSARRLCRGAAAARA